MPTALVIDDSSVQLMVARLILEEGGYDVKDATGGDDGIAIARAGGVDVILLDWLMPDTSGAEVLEALNKDNNRTPVIVVTGDPEDAREQCLQLGAITVLDKPPDSEVLLAAVRSALS